MRAAARPNANLLILGIAARCLALASGLDEARVFAVTSQVASNYSTADFLDAFRFALDTAALFRRVGKRVWFG